jgi:ElaB/YqjD/DUF883 family membrane-anchored ribosome-binding protein
MARPRKHSPPTNHAPDVLESVNRLVDAITSLLNSVGHAAAGAAVQLRASGAPTLAKAPAAVAAKSVKLRKAVAASWARYTPAEREARIRKMLAGRGLKRKKPARAGAVKRRRGRGRSESGRAAPGVHVGGG